MNFDTINNDVTMAGGAGGALLAGRYRVVHTLGQGGMGSVWLAEDTQLDNKQFAVKMLPSILVSNKRAYRQLKDEALVAMKLVHPNIVQLRAFEENGGNPFLVMDYIEGETLDDYLAEHGGEVLTQRHEGAGAQNGMARTSAATLGGLSESEVLRILKPIAAALDYAHSEGVVHRDIKPANVMIRKDGRPFILDFGIAREIQETMTRVTGKLSSGTLLYMSPEQLNGAAPKPAQDVYSFAAMAYECLRGEPPFSRGQIEYQILNNPPPPLDDSAAGGVIVESIMAGLAKKPEGRPPCCAEVLEWSAAVRKREEAERSKRENAEREAAALKARLAREEAEKRALEERERREAEAAELKAAALKARMEAERAERDAAAHAASSGSRQEIAFADPGTNVISSFLEKNAATLFWGLVAVVVSIVVIGIAGNLRGRDGTSGTGYGMKSQSPNSTPPLRPAPSGGLTGANDVSPEPIETYNPGNVDLGTSDPIVFEDEAVSSGETERLPPASGQSLQERASKDDPQAQYELALRLYKGDGMEKDLSASAYWAEKAALQGNAAAAFLSGLIYYDGTGVAQDYRKARDLFVQAYNGGNFEACYNLGLMYEKGLGCIANAEEAAKWYAIGDNNGIASASNNLGLMYLDGKGVANDGRRALALFTKALEKGSWVSAYNIGCMYMNGKGIARDFAAARRYFNMVIEKSRDSDGIVKLAREGIADMDKQNMPLAKLKPVVRLAVFRRTASGSYEQCDTATVIGDEPGLRFYRDSKRTHFLVLSSDDVSTLLGASGAIVSGSMFSTFKISEENIRECQKDSGFVQIAIAEQEKPILHLTASVDGVRKEAMVTKGIVESYRTTPMNVTVNVSVGDNMEFACEYIEGGVRYEGSAKLIARKGYSSYDVKMKPVSYCGHCGKYIKGCCDMSGRCPFCSANLREL